MAQVFKADVIGHNSVVYSASREIAFSSTPTITAYTVTATSNAAMYAAGSRSYVVIPAAPGATNIGVNYYCTQTLDQLLARMNEDVTADLTVVGDLTVTGHIISSLTTGITAFAGGGQGSATALTTDYNIVTTVATAADSVKLPTAVAGLVITVKNTAANACDVYPFSGDAINGGSADASISLPANVAKTFICNSTSNWETTTESISTDVVWTDTVNAKTASGVVAVSAPIKFSGTPQTLTGAGAVNLTTYSTLLVTTGANALTLAAGAEGQFKFIRMKTDGGDGTLTVTNLQGGTTLTFNDAGDFVHLLYQDAKWNILTNSGCTLA